MSYGKVSPLLNQNIDPLNVTKRVYWRPTTTGTALRIGDAVCYNFDLARDYKERATQPASGGTTYAEGSQNYTARLFNVEEPLVHNLDHFAGIVTKLGDKAGADGDLIEIAMADSGAVVPARVGLAATVVGRTILAIEADNRTLGDPVCDCDDYGMDTAGSSPSRVVGVAMETIAAAGLCWVKLNGNQFINQAVNDSYEYQVGVGNTTAVNLAVNKMFLNFRNTDGHSCACLWRTQLSGTGSGAAKGVYRFDVMMNATSYGEHIRGVDVNVDVACSANQTIAYHVYGLSVMLRTQSNPTMTDATVAIVNLESFLRKNAAADALDDAPNAHTWFRFNANGSVPGFLFYTQGVGILGDTDCEVGGAGRVVGFDSDASIKKIPIKIGANTYYILAGTTVDDADAA